MKSISAYLFCTVFLTTSALATDEAEVADITECPVSYDVGFSPRGNALDLILAELASAKESIYLAAYSFTSQPVVDALIAAHERGVTVSVVVNKGSINGNGAKARYLKGNNIPIKMNSKYSIMHNKFFLVDNKSLKTGSFNYSAAAHQRNAENILIIRCVDEVITQYQQEFTRLWDESIEIPEISTS
ncbi:phospholipase D family protein [Yersinia enterocolitica]